MQVRLNADQDRQEICRMLKGIKDKDKLGWNTEKFFSLLVEKLNPK